MITGLILSGLVALGAATGVGINGYLTQRAQLNTIHTAQQYITECTPKNTVIAVDMHGVLALLNWNKVFEVAKTDWSNALIGGRGYGIISLWKFGTNCKERRYDLLAQQNPIYTQGRPMFIKLANAHVINQALLRNLLELKERGYTICLASNIGPDMLAQAKRQDFSLSNLFDVEVHPSEKNEWISKPDPKFYQEVEKLTQEKNPQKQLKYVVFVDDKPKTCTVPLKADGLKMRWIPFVYSAKQHADFEKFSAPLFTQNASK